MQYRYKKQRNPSGSREYFRCFLQDFLSQNPMKQSENEPTFS